MPNRMQFLCQSFLRRSQGVCLTVSILSKFRAKANPISVSTQLCRSRSCEYVDMEAIGIGLVPTLCNHLYTSKFPEMQAGNGLAKLAHPLPLWRYLYVKMTLGVRGMGKTRILRECRH